MDGQTEGIKKKNQKYFIMCQSIFTYMCLYLSVCLSVIYLPICLLSKHLSVSYFPKWRQTGRQADVAEATWSPTQGLSDNEDSLAAESIFSQAKGLH